LPIVKLGRRLISHAPASWGLDYSQWVACLDPLEDRAPFTPEFHQYVYQVLFLFWTILRHDPPGIADAIGRLFAVIPEIIIGLGVPSDLVAAYVSLITSTRA
jgi:hypothetical protein